MLELVKSLEKSWWRIFQGPGGGITGLEEGAEVGPEVGANVEGADVGVEVGGTVAGVVGPATATELYISSWIQRKKMRRSQAIES